MENLLVENIPLPIFVINKVGGRVIYVNSKFRNLFGYSLKDIPTVSDWNNRAYPDPVYRKQVMGELLDEAGTIKGRAAPSREVLVCCKNGATRIVELTRTFIQEKVIVVFNDLTERKLAEKMLTESVAQIKDDHQRLNFHFNRMPLAYVAWDRDFCVTEWNPAAERMFGWMAEEAKGQHAFKLIVPPDVQPMVDAIWTEIVQVGNDESNFINDSVTKDGKRIVCEWFNSPLSKDGTVVGCLSIINDISEHKIIQAQIEFLAHHDALTQLPNRLLVTDRMNQAMAHADRVESKVALFFIDLDNFKSVNDSLGHTIGDELLKAVADRMQQSVRDTDTISRLGGDEFLIVISDVSDGNAISDIAEKILDCMTKPFNIEGQDIFTSISMGIAVYPDDGENFESLRKKADIAMYCAKEAGRNTYRFYDEQMNLHAIEHIHILNGLRSALENGEFVLFYQPQVNIASREVVGVEALIRWNHPEKGMIPPQHFIPVAESSGLIVPIGEWVLHAACRQVVEWGKEGLPDLVVAVNLSAVQFKRGELEASVDKALSESGLDPAQLELELTESILIDDTERVLDTVRRLKSLGVRLSIDDFGTGYSSFSYLKRFEVDKLKIDKSFIRDMAENPDDTAIVAAIINMAKSLNLTTIAEGVEHAQHLELLRLHDCDEVQGYHIAEPMPAEDFVLYLMGKKETEAEPVWHARG